jgi:hypothetical protein
MNRSAFFLASLCCQVSAAAIIALVSISCAAAQSPWERPFDEVKYELGQLLNCKSFAHRSCAIEGFGGYVDVFVDAADTLETISLNPIVVTHPPRPMIESLNHEIALKIMDYLLPGWTDRRRWMASALKSAVLDRRRYTAKIGAVSIMVEELQPADIDDEFASVVLTKNPSLDAVLRELGLDHE